MYPSDSDQLPDQSKAVKESPMTRYQYPISRYLNIRQAAAPSWSSDSHNIAFLANVTGTPQVWRVRPQPLGSLPPWPSQLTYDADRVLAVQCSPAPGDGRILYAADSGGNENAHLWLQNPDGSEACLTQGHEKAMHNPGHWSPDGRMLTYSANRDDPGRFGLYLQDMQDPTSEARLIWASSEPGYLREMVLSPDGKSIAVVRVKSSFSHDLVLVDIESGAPRTLHASEELTTYGDISFSADGRWLWLLADAGADFVYIARLGLESGEMEPIIQAEWDIEGFSVSPDGERIVFSTNVDGGSELRLRELADGSTFTAISTQSARGVVGLAGGGAAFSPDGRRVAFSFSSSTRTYDIHVWDLATGSVQQLTQSSHGGIAMETFVEPALIHYPTMDGLDIPGWFYAPRSTEARFPVVVYVHGGPEGQFRPYMNYVVQFFVQRGFGVLAPNVRGSVGYGKAYSHLDDVRKRMDSVADLAHAAHWLREQPNVDPKRIAIMGGSYGGFMVLSAVTTYPELWAAGVDIVGISNLATFLENTSTYRRSHRAAEYGSLDDDREFLEEIAPANHLDRLRAPLIVIHGRNDPRVPLSEAEQLVSTLQEQGSPTELFVFDDEGHGVVKLKNKLVAYPAIAAFLEKHLAA
jgi:dipeptidyl aminopeptidase/acylaminoacyl peptidase